MCSYWSDYTEPEVRGIYIHSVLSNTAACGHFPISPYNLCRYKLCRCHLPLHSLLFGSTYWTLWHWNWRFSICILWTRIRCAKLQSKALQHWVIQQMLFSKVTPTDLATCQYGAGRGSTSSSRTPSGRRQTPGFKLVTFCLWVKNTLGR